MASVGLWFAFFMSLKFVTPAHSQTPPPAAPAGAPLPGGEQKLEPPAAGDLPPEFMDEAKGGGAQQGAPPAGKMPPPPAEPPAENQAGEAAPPPQQPAQQEAPPSQAPSQEAMPPAVDAGGAAPIVPQFAADEQYSYDPTGRRDPFKPYKSYRPSPTVSNGSSPHIADLSDPLQRWEIERFSVVAIMWEVRNPRAMVKDPDGKMYMIGKHTRIGRNNGQVVAIREGEVVVVEEIENEGVQTREVRVLELKK